MDSFDKGLQFPGQIAYPWSDASWVSMCPTKKSRINFGFHNRFPAILLFSTRRRVRHTHDVNQYLENVNHNSILYVCV